MPVFDQPVGIPDTFEKHAKLMYDLWALAFQTDLTRVGTFMIGKEVTGRSYPEIGVSMGHHGASHHQNDPKSLEALAKINTYHMEMFAYFLGKLQSIPDGDGSLLDHTILMHGTGISDGNLHFHLDLPMVVAGGAAGHLKTGRHLRYHDDTPLTNLYLTVLDKLGLEVETFGDSTGRIEHL